MAGRMGWGVGLNLTGLLPEIILEAGRVESLEFRDSTHLNRISKKAIKIFLLLYPFLADCGPSKTDHPPKVGGDPSESRVYLYFSTVAPCDRRGIPYFRSLVLVLLHASRGPMPTTMQSSGLE